MSEPIVVSDDEAEELHRFTLNDYISQRNYPALMRLLDRVGVRVQELNREGVRHVPLRPA